MKQKNPRKYIIAAPVWDNEMIGKPDAYVMAALYPRKAREYPQGKRRHDTRESVFWDVCEMYRDERWDLKYHAGVDCYSIVVMGGKK